MVLVGVHHTRSPTASYGYRVIASRPLLANAIKRLRGTRTSRLTPGSGSDPLAGLVATLVREEFQPDWYLSAYPDVAARIREGTLPSALWHYVEEGTHGSRSPNSWFDEQWYLHEYPDVAHAKATGIVPNGFVHYLRYGRAEGRQVNAASHASLAHEFNTLNRPVGLERLVGIEHVLAPVHHKVFPATGTRRVNFLVPTLDKSLLFGGYIAALNFLKRLLDRGWEVRLLITEDATCTTDRLVEQFAKDPIAASVVGRAELVNLAQRSVQLGITGDDSFIAYSTWAAHHADELARAVGRRFVFFVQEYEPAFHSHDSLHAIGAAAYRKPHFAVFNSAMLRRYFASEGIGVYSQGERYGQENSAVFEHSLAIPSPPRQEELVRGGVRRLLFYARPEAHASRNLFEVGVFALRRAVANGAFDDGTWTFDGIGSLATETSVPLGRGKVLEIRPRLSLDDYAGALREFEVGMSLQYAPHPGVVHFEMASSGMAVVTNTFVNRCVNDLVAISSNLVPAEPTPDALSLGLARAAVLSRDLPACVRGADGAFVRSWEESFNDTLMATIEAELA